MGSHRAGSHDGDTEVLPPVGADAGSFEQMAAEIRAADDAAAAEPEQPQLMARSRHKWAQVDRALGFLAWRANVPDLVQRAAFILLAPRNAPHLEKTAGGRANTDLEGKKVRCRACKRQYTATVEEPYLNATSPKDGICAGCLVLTESRYDDAEPDPPARASRPRRNPTGEEPTIDDPDPAGTAG
jgi:hypothetical protein